MSLTGFAPTRYVPGTSGPHPAAVRRTIEPVDRAAADHPSGAPAPSQPAPGLPNRPRPAEKPPVNIVRPSSPTGRTGPGTDCRRGRHDLEPFWPSRQPHLFDQTCPGSPSASRPSAR
ncbi:hypothetical protein GCM10010502_27850 [Kitasatospora aureofaciens]|uniref:Uncharacterized protein n=1 Tax=Kitasatospora aureofaciens TaxID=1894 RepID=A0A8H9HMQ4_KITAU|nr:hypothetical protein GCM10010502_27850 [Kitasatospora aureofaciens]